MCMGVALSAPVLCPKIIRLPILSKQDSSFEISYAKLPNPYLSKTATHIIDKKLFLVLIP